MSRASWHMGLEARIVDRQTVTKLNASSIEYANACGVIIEVSMWGVHKTCRSVADEWGWGGTPHCFTRAKDHTGSRWAMPSEDAVVRALWMDLDWPWEPSASWLFLKCRADQGKAPARQAS